MVFPVFVNPYTHLPTAAKGVGCLARCFPSVSLAPIKELEAAVTDLSYTVYTGSV